MESFEGGWWGSCAQASGVVEWIWTERLLGGERESKAHRSEQSKAAAKLKKSSQCQMTFSLGPPFNGAETWLSSAFAAGRLGEAGQPRRLICWCRMRPCRPAAGHER